MDMNTASPLLQVRDLVTQVATPDGARTVVDRLSFDLKRGETLCIAGESGSGKSMTVLSLMQLLPKNLARVAGGSAIMNGRDILKLDEGQMRGVRGRHIGMIFQEPMTSLNPVLTIGRQLAEAVGSRSGLSGAAMAQRCKELLDEVQISDAARRLLQYPHELSGGMRQRVMIAMALAQKPEILIADEPLAGLDPRHALDSLSRLRAVARAGGVVVAAVHDLTLAARFADRILALHEGSLAADGTPRQVLTPATLRHVFGVVARLKGEGEGAYVEVTAPA